MKCAIFSCVGLGDGLIALVLANNLRNNGHSVITFHPTLHSLASWFPGLEIASFPFPVPLSSFERIFIVYEKSPSMQAILQEALTHFRSITTVINPIATPNTDYPFWEEGRFDGRMSYVDNLVGFCKAVLQLDRVGRDNGMMRPEGCSVRAFPKRVIIHPTSSKDEKNWSEDKYRLLEKQLETRGFEPVFVVGEAERARWAEGLSFSSLDALARFVGESGYFIGNDSGIGHLASCLGLPTVTLCRNHQTGRFWRPSWARGEIIYPSKMIPNLKGFRLRDRYWREWISVNQVMKKLQVLINLR